MDILTLERRERENKRTATVVSIVIHAALLLLILLFSSTVFKEEPLDEEGGGGGGSGERVALAYTSVETMPVAQHKPKEETPIPVTKKEDEKVITDQKNGLELAVKSNDTKKPTEKKPTEKPKDTKPSKTNPPTKPEETKVDNSTLLTGKIHGSKGDPSKPSLDNKYGGGGTGGGTGSGEGSGKGPGKGSGSGGGDGSGNGQGTGDGPGGRKIVTRCKGFGDWAGEKGVVAVKITVTPSGKVIGAEYSYDGSTISKNNAEQVREAIDCAKQYQYQPSSGTTENQTGILKIKFGYQ